MDSTSRSVAVTGALGNLGWKLLNHLAAHSTCSRLVGLDVKEADQAQRDELRKAAKGREVEIEFVPCDLTDWRDRRWRDAFDRVDAVVHFAAKNPYPEASWSDVDASVAMNYNTAHAATDSKSVNRYVFATSNHVMGRYKDRPLGPGELRPELEPGVGTLWHTGEKDMDSTVYATAKWAGERLCQALGQRAGGETSFACVRIGWCQPGENNPRTLSAAGTPTQAGSGGEESETDAWYKGMWLSNGDFCQLFQRAIEADASAWPGGCIVVNGMSNNTGMKWNLEAARQYLNYEPRDDVYAS
jgi:nucleoside-diphosphate-sugar epimerase